MVGELELVPPYLLLFYSKYTNKSTYFAVHIKLGDCGHIYINIKFFGNILFQLVFCFPVQGSFQQNLWKFNLF